MNKDLRFIKLQSDPLVRAGERVMYQWWYWFLIVLGLVAMIGTVLYVKRRDQIGSNRALGRRLKAYNKAQHQLKQARKVLDDENQVYALLSQALIGYIGDTLNLPEKALETNALLNAVKERSVGEETVSELSAILIRLDMGRFAPGADESGTSDLIHNATKLLSDLSRELKG